MLNRSLVSEYLAPEQQFDDAITIPGSSGTHVRLNVNLDLSLYITRQSYTGKLPACLGWQKIAKA